MKATASLFPVFLTLLSVLCCACVHAEDKLYEADGLGKLVLGQKAEDVTQVLSKPASRGTKMFWDATGQWVQDWEYPAQGLSLKVASSEKTGAGTLLMITASGECKLATKRGIKIGSTEAEVKKAYQDVGNAEESKAGESFVAGSIYGGVIFTFKEGKVSEIFIGAAAE